MDHPARLPIDCPRCENRGVLALDDDRTIACPLCNNWCMLCLDNVPAFVQVTRPYRGSLIAGMRPTANGETLFEGYTCDYHKAALRSSSYIAPPTVGRYQVGQSYLAAQGRVFVVRYAYGEAANWQALEDAARQAIGTYRCAPYMGRSSIPVQQSLLRSSYADDETFTAIVRANKAIRIERSRTFWYNCSLRRRAGVRGRGAGALFGRAVRGGRVGERQLADEGVTVILLAL
jgi:hypothetical protein